MTNEDDRRVDSRVSSLETAVEGISTLLRQVITEWSTERKEIRSEIRAMSEVYTAGRSVNWGWVFGGLAVIVTIVLALGNGFLSPVARDVANLQKDNVQLDATLTAHMASQTMIAIEHAQEKGRLLAEVEQAEYQLDFLWALMVGNGATNTGLLPRQAQADAYGLAMKQRIEKIERRLPK